MTLAPGARLGPYEILAPLGTGGMGEVWRARDLRLDREVAIKSLPAGFALDPSRLARFEREARLLAALQHARIATIHGLEESGSHRYLVMELVAGESLAHRIASGPVPVPEALEIARQIAEGLEAAHEKGIVHRDLKPGNVQLGPEGSVKLLDFGLAKALDPVSPESGADALSRSPTISEQMTGTIILGTAAYMSPEQARGRPTDRRSDIWSFGAVLFELLSGKRLFSYETVSDTLAAVLRADPDWSALPPDTPPNIQRLLARCLERDPKNRLHDIADARIELEETIRGLRGGSAILPVPRPRLSRLWLVALPACATLVAAFALGRWTGQRAAPATPAPSLRAVLPLPAGHRLAGWASPVLALSPDGRKLAFVAESDRDTQDLWIHHLDRGEAQKVPGGENAEGPFFSPDSQWVAFAVEVSGRTARPGELKKYSLASGLTQSICGLKDFFGGDWGADGTILFSEVPSTGIQRIDASGGKPQPAMSSMRLGGREVSRAIAWPQRLPGGKSLLVSDWDASRFGDAAVLNLESRELTHVHVKALFARYVPSGHLLFLKPDATLMVAPFDPVAAKLTGPDVAIGRDVSISNSWGAVFATSDGGTFVSASGYLRGSGREPMKLVRAAQGGKISDVAADAFPYGRYPRISPDGRRIAVPDWDGTLWIVDALRGTRMQLPTGRVVGQEFQAWSPDGQWLVFVGGEEGKTSWGIYRQRPDGSAAPEVLLEGDGIEKHPYSFTPDGRGLLYARVDELLLLPLEGKAAPWPVLRGEYDMPALSPDGRWLAYDGDPGSGTTEVFVQSYPPKGGRVQVSSGGGMRPVWTRQGNRLFFRKGGQVLSVTMGGTPEAPEPSSPAVFAELSAMRGFDVTPDGREVVAIVRPAGTGIVRQLSIVTNWFEQLKRVAPTGSR